MKKRAERRRPSNDRLKRTVLSYDKLEPLAKASHTSPKGDQNEKIRQGLTGSKETALFIFSFNFPLDHF